MPQKSFVFATGSVRVLEGRLISAERIERLIAAANASEAVRLLQEAGYGRNEDVLSPYEYEGWLAQQAEQLYYFVRTVTPETASTDCFLMRKDYKNAQAYYKAKGLSGETQVIVASGGLIDPQVIEASIREQEYARLPHEMREALKKLDAISLAGIEPRTVDIELDKAMFENIARTLKRSKSKLVKQYFADLSDLVNLRTALRARLMRLSADALREQLVSGGEVPLDKFVAVFDEPERAAIVFSAKEYKRHMEDAVSSYQHGGNLSKLERLMDNQLLKTIKKGQWNMNSVEPLIAYMLGLEREMAAVRLIMVGHINGFPADAVRERLGDLYV